MSSPTNGTSTGAGGGWEKVGGGGNKGKTGKKNASKFSKTEKKKFAETAPRLQDVRKWHPSFDDTTFESLKSHFALFYSFSKVDSSCR